MSRFTEIQKTLAATLSAHPGFPAKLQIIARREKEVANDIESALGKHGICLYVMPPIPKQAVRTLNHIVFFERSELRIRIIEQPKINSSGFDAWEAMEQVIIALQGLNPDDTFAEPLNLADRPVDAVEDQTTRCYDVLFNAAFQLN